MSRTDPAELLELPAQNIGDSLLIRISDNPRISLAQVAPNISEYTDIDMSWRFTVYAVWEFKDKTIYPLGKIKWAVRWAGRLGSIQLTTSSPVTYFWLPAATNKNIMTDEFERSDSEPILNLPAANNAINAAGGRFQ